jgi:hypothetical protein
MEALRRAKKVPVDVIAAFIETASVGKYIDQR